MRLGQFYLLGLVGLVCGCDNERTVTQQSNCFDACLDASVDVDINARLAIATALRQNLETARAGLSVYTSAASALSQFVQSMVDSKAAVPAGLHYQGNGVFVADVNADTSVRLSFYLPTKTSYAEAGSLIDFNLFDPANYFTSLGVKTEVSVGLSGISSQLSFTFSKLGPGAELLGIAPTASGSVPVDVGQFSSRLSQVLVQASVDFAQDSASGMAFSLKPASLPAGSVGSGKHLLSIVGLSAPGASLQLGSVTLALQNPGNLYDGLVHVTSLSSDFSFQFLLKYSGSLSGDLTLGCLGIDL